MQCQGPLHLDTVLQHRRYGRPGLALSCAEHRQEQGHDSLQDPLRIHASIWPYVCRHRMHAHAAYVSSSTKQGFTNEPATTGSSSIALTQPLLQARTAAYCCFQMLDCQRYLLQLLRQQLIGTRAGSLERTAQHSPQCAYCVLEEAQQPSSPLPYAGLVRELGAKTLNAASTQPKHSYVSTQPELLPLLLSLSLPLPMPLPLPLPAPLPL